MLTDGKNSISVVAALAPAAVTATATGPGVDTGGAGTVAFILNPGVRTDGTHTPKLQESADNSTFTDVATGDQLGLWAVVASNTLQTVGYVGRLRYVRLVLTVASATTGAVVGATCELSGLRKQVGP